MFNQIMGSESGKIAKWATITLMLLSAFLFVHVVSGLWRLPNIDRETYPQSTITATGKGEAYAIPDVGSFSFTVTETAESTEAAQKLLNEKVSSAIAAVKQMGVEEKDVKTINYNVYPKYQWSEIVCVTYPCPRGENKLIGYEVSQTILVKVRDLDKAGTLVDEVGAIGISNIGGIQFEVDDREKYVAEAREQAIADAKEQGKILAKQLGVRLGKVLYFNENGGYPTPYYAEGMGGGDITMSASMMKAEIPVGENKIESQVSITYEID